ncbi:hypothetical protein ENSA7_08690 [Enhygromyxa salina]|uniref:Uncharacterized protein n=1 Tax=Enhygromyxa salina TaxID=215803 RepID=A0A2S9YWD0_9BACT|nr:hypothetical protein ENSA7_08690 [Enhygromyxa salina]
MLGDHAGLDGLGLSHQLIIEIVAHVEQRRAAARQPDHGQITQVLKDRDRELHQVAADRRQRLEPSQDLRGVAIEHSLKQLGDREAPGLTEHREHLVGLDLGGVLGERDDLVEQRQRVADRAIATARDHGEALGLDRELLLREDLLQIRDQRCCPHAPIVEP